MCKSLPPTGFVRIKVILELIPVSKSAWWAGVRSGRYPQPVKLGPRTTVWRVEDIRKLIDGGVVPQGCAMTQEPLRS